MHIHIHIHVQMYIYVHMYVCWAVVTFRTHPPTRDSGVSDSQLVCVYDKKLRCLYIHYIYIYIHTHQRETAESPTVSWCVYMRRNCAVYIYTIYTYIHPPTQDSGVSSHAHTHTDCRNPANCVATIRFPKLLSPSTD